MQQEKQIVHDRDLAIVIGNIMRWGVILALSFAAFGGIIYLIRHGNESTSFSTFNELNLSVKEILSNTFSGLIHFKGRAYITLGILILFATPVLRVIFSLIGFILEKDKLYIVITLIVLAIIALSISGSLAH